MIILGIDPGSLVTGFGVIETEGNKEKLLAQGIIRLNPTESHQNRLRRIYQEIAALIQLHLPDTCAIEMPIYGKNAQSMLKLGRAQAAAMLASLNHQVPVTEYTPKEVKKAVTGNGNASKEQVRYMICSILSIAEIKTVGQTPLMPLPSGCVTSTDATPLLKNDTVAGRALFGQIRVESFNKSR